MLKGIEYLQARSDGSDCISVFEAIYAIATTVNDWNIATNATLLILNSMDFNNSRRIVFEAIENEATSPTPRPDQQDSQALYFTSNLRGRISEGSTCCLQTIAKYAHDPELSDSLRKFRVIYGVPVCGIEEFDLYLLDRKEVDTLIHGMSSTILSAISEAQQIVHDQKIKLLADQINILKEQLAEFPDGRKELNAKSMGFAGKVILACARHIIGEDASKSMSTTQITTQLLNKTASEGGVFIASEKSILEYIKAGKSREQ